ncbi:MAG: hypothetical protein QOG87_921 [Actinomycetota bacterium]
MIEITPDVTPEASSVRRFTKNLDLRGLGKYGAVPILVLTLFAVTDNFGNAASSLLLNDVQREFKINLSYLVRISINVGAVAAVLAVFFGYMADRSNRVRLLGVGVALTGVSYVLTAASQSKGQYVGAQLFSALTVILTPVLFSLLADWYPLERRGRVFSFYFMGQAIGDLIAPIAVGAAGLSFGWRAPMLFMVAIPTLLLVPFTLLLRNPIRGYWERIASTANEETALKEDAPPSPGEAFRTYWSTRTLRRLSYAQPFARTRSAQGAALLLFYIVVHGLDSFRLGMLTSLYAAFSIVGLYVGGRMVDRFAQVSPGKMMMLSGIGSLINALSVLVIVFAPQLWMVVFFNCVLGLVLAIPDAAEQAVVSSVIPPRVRGLGLSAFGLWGIGGLFLILATQAVSGDVGIRGAVLCFVPMQAIAAIIRMSAASFVEFDLRAARAKAMATADWAEAKRQGRDKLLVCRDVDVYYGSVQVLFGVDFEAEEGEIVALLGTNGAGKSTLLRAISGVTEATNGAILFDGDDVTHIPPHEIAGKGVAQTPGGRGVFPGLTVRENLELAGWLHHDIEDRLEEVFGHFPVLRERLDETAGNLSGGQQQMLTLAQAFLTQPKLLMIDELSLGLAPAVVAQLLDMLRVIHAGGTTIILVEQSVNVALSIAQRAVFMEKGEVRFTGPTEELLDRPDILRSVFLKGASGGGSGRGRAVAPLTASAERERARLAESAIVLEAVDLSKRFGGVLAVDDVSLELREGEVLGLIGPNGAGKSTVLGLLSGFITADAGRVVFEGQDVSDLSPDERARQGLVRRFQDALLFPSLTVSETLAVALERSIEVRSPIAQALRLPSARISEAKVLRRVETLVELFELGGFRDKFVGELSTGTRRVLDLACVLAVEPRVLLLDEPSSGLAQRETEAMGPLIRRIRYETGASIAIVEHDMPLIASVSDELLAMDLGRTVLRGTPDEVLNDERVVASYLGSSGEAIARSGRVR